MSRASIKAYQDKYGIDMWNAGLIDFLFFINFVLIKYA